MNTEQLTQQLKACEERLFVLELDDLAYCHGKGREIRALYDQIKALRAQLAQA